MKGHPFFRHLFILLALLGGWPHHAQGEPKDFLDALGRTVTVSFPPKRIVSLTPDITETLFALGLDDEIVGVTRFSNFPPAAGKKPKIGSYVDINTEAVVHLEPDLIVGSAAGNSPVQVRQLERLGFPVFVVYPKDLAGILRSIQQIADVAGKGEAGRAIVAEMNGRIERVSRHVAGREKPKVFLQIGRDPLFTVSKGSFADHLIWLAGGENIAQDASVPYPSYSLEEILLKAPAVIIISSMYVGGDHCQWLEDWKRWELLPAVRHGRLYTVDSDLIDRPSPRIVQGLEEIARMIHPEAFPAGR